MHRITLGQQALANSLDAQTKTITPSEARISALVRIRSVIALHPAVRQRPAEYPDKQVAVGSEYRMRVYRAASVQVHFQEEQ
jgi:hypothetical protein